MPDSGGLGQRILQARLNMAARLGRPVTQGEIGDAMKVTAVSVGRWENGVKEPDLATIEKLARVLGVDPRWLAFGDPPSTIPPASPDAARPSLPTPPWPADYPGELPSIEREAKRRRRKA